MILGHNTQLIYIHMIKHDKNIKFLYWLKNRLKLRYAEKDDLIYKTLDDIIDHIQKSRNIDQQKIIKVCQKMHPFFESDKDEKSMFDIGYSKTEKLEIMKYVASVIEIYHE